ncbi:hypothetical protein [Cryobacterium tagatosivorans]|uniref:Uncharacterized protein n=1 Tax=Cryobacterium tagatosivorans TaxID=1259199 RepID=A0A4R8U9W5_9MICO|nr:hypothetical protein [Cryobacterium tagatosivorans]TFB46554.1 hypothetical protein E3O23_17420 [Cryobacterium tagatosivorans]
MVILIGLMVVVIMGAFVVLDRRERAARSLSERREPGHGEPGHGEPGHSDDQADARAAAQAAQMGRGGWPVP